MILVRRAGVEVVRVDAVLDQPAIRRRIEPRGRVLLGRFVRSESKRGEGAKQRRKKCSMHWP
jgi:hypothetical protein